MPDSITEAAEELTQQFTEQLEYELRAAWRAGYDYVHVYDTLNCGGMRLDSFSVKKRIHPSHCKQPPRPDGVRYQYTYILDDELMREAKRRSRV